MSTNEWKSRVSGAHQEPWAKSLRGGISKMASGVGATSKYRKFSVADDSSSSIVAAVHGRKRRVSSLSEFPANECDRQRPEHVAKAPGRVAKPPKPLRKPPVPAAFKPRRSSIVEESIRPTTLFLDPKELLAAKPEPIVSPVPLPPDVVCIDPVDDETLAYFPEFVRYLRHRETEWIHRKKDIVGTRMDVEANRALLMNWLLEVALHFRVSQETLYHTVGMIDATLAMRDVDNEHLQLVSVTSLLIAAKLEEYHPPSIKDLLAITEDSYTFDDVVKMERKLLALHDFRGYNAEPMVFINRFVRAAFQDSNSVFRNVCLLFYDCLIPTIGFSAIRVSEKAAAAVFAARIMLHDIDEIDFEIWPPTLAYYTGYEEKDVSILARSMVEQLSKCLRQAACAGGKEKGVLRKFRSRSTHDAVVRLPQLSLESIEEKMKDLSAAAARREFY